MWVQDCRREHTAVLVWPLGQRSLSAPLGPWRMDIPSTYTHPEPALDSFGIWGHLMYFKEVEKRISTFSSSQISCVQLFKDSAQQSERRLQSPIWLPLLVLSPRALHSRHTTPQYTQLDQGEKCDTASGPCMTSERGKKHLRNPFHPAHHDIGVNIKASSVYPLSCNPLHLSCRNPYISLFARSSRGEDEATLGWLRGVACPGISCSVLPYRASCQMS